MRGRGVPGRYQTCTLRIDASHLQASDHTKSRAAPAQTTQPSSAQQKRRAASAADVQKVCQRDFQTVVEVGSTVECEASLEKTSTGPARRGDAQEASAVATLRSGETPDRHEVFDESTAPADTQCTHADIDTTKERAASDLQPAHNTADGCDFMDATTPPTITTPGRVAGVNDQVPSAIGCLPQIEATTRLANNNNTNTSNTTFTFIKPRTASAENLNQQAVATACQPLCSGSHPLFEVPCENRQKSRRVQTETPEWVFFRDRRLGRVQRRQQRGCG